MIFVFLKLGLVDKDAVQAAQRASQQFTKLQCRVRAVLVARHASKNLVSTDVVTEPKPIRAHGPKRRIAVERARAQTCEQS